MPLTEPFRYPSFKFINGQGPLPPRGGLPAVALAKVGAARWTGRAAGRLSATLFIADGIGAAACNLTLLARYDIARAAA